MKNKKLVMTISISSVFLVCFLVALFTIIIPDIKQKKQDALVQEYRDNKIALYEEQNEKYNDYEVDVAFIGDSLTDGYDLNKHYGSLGIIVNRGIAGNTTFDVEDRLEVSLFDLKPKVVVMLIGGNNLGSMFDNYEDILKELQEKLPETKVVLLSLTAMGGDWAGKNSIAALNNIKIEKYATDYNFEFVDLFRPLFDYENGEIYEEYTFDGAHLTEEGYEVITEQVKPLLQEILSNWGN